MTLLLKMERCAGLPPNHDLLSRTKQTYDVAAILAEKGPMSKPTLRLGIGYRRMIFYHEILFNSHDGILIGHETFNLSGKYSCEGSSDKELSHISTLLMSKLRSFPEFNTFSEHVAAIKRGELSLLNASKVASEMRPLKLLPSLKAQCLNVILRTLETDVNYKKLVYSSLTSEFLEMI